MTPFESLQALLDAIAASPDRAALEVPALHVVREFNDRFASGHDLRLRLPPAPEPIRRAHAYERKRRLL